MSVRHHPADAILAAYAGGGLRAGFDLVVAAHLESCPKCRHTVRLFEDAAGGMLGAAEPETVDADALGRLMARVEREPQTTEPTPAADTRPLIQRLPLKRRRWLGPKVWVQPVDVEHARDDRVYLLYVAGGLKGLDHGHSGPEFTQVISGALHDTGEVFRAGDFVERDAGDEHQPMVGPDDGGCLCLAATEGPLIAHGWFNRLVRAAAGV